MTIPIFIVYSTPNVNHIINLLVPSLKEQLIDRDIYLYLVNYHNNTPLITSINNHQKLKIYDLSAYRENTAIGFGESINYLFNKISPSDFFIILNPDTIADKMMISNLVRVYYDQENVGIVEAKQWPYEHPKEYDKVNFTTPWASGCAALIDSNNFQTIGGFDPIYFLYCEDVDISWRTWLNGKKVLYAPDAKIVHLTGLLSYRKDRYYYENFYSIRNFIVISRKFFGSKGEKNAINMIKSCVSDRNLLDNVIDSYNEIKMMISNDFKNHSKHKMIKITGINTYHERII